MCSNLALINLGTYTYKRKKEPNDRFNKKRADHLEPRKIILVLVLLIFNLFFSTDN